MGHFPLKAFRRDLEIERHTRPYACVPRNFLKRVKKSVFWGCQREIEYVLLVYILHICINNNNNERISRALFHVKHAKCAEQVQIQK